MHRMVEGHHLSSAGAAHEHHPRRLRRHGPSEARDSLSHTGAPTRIRLSRMVSEHDETVSNTEGRTRRLMAVGSHPPWARSRTSDAGLCGFHRARQLL